MNNIDRQLLTQLQRDSTQPLSALAEKVGLSTSACHRRVRQLEGKGLIAGYRAELNPKELGLQLEVLVQITLLAENDQTLERFENAVKRHSEILECWLVAGQADYVLRIMALDIDDFDRIHRVCLSRLPGVSSMHSSFVLRRIKRWRGYSLSSDTKVP